MPVKFKGRKARKQAREPSPLKAASEYPAGAPGVRSALLSVGEIEQGLAHEKRSKR